MTTSYPSQDDQPLVHELLRRLGHGPAVVETEKLHSPQTRVLAALARIRHLLARLVLQS